MSHAPALRALAAVAALLAAFIRARLAALEFAADAAPPVPGQDKGDSTSLQRECSARASSGKSIHASRPFREMIARPKISQNEWKPAEI